MRWNSKRSVGLSLACNRIIMALIVGAAVFMLTPFGFDYVTYSLVSQDYVENRRMTVAICLAGCAVALFALYLLDALLRNIRKDEVFVRKNVSALRGISWCCFAETALLSAAAWQLAFIFFVIAAMAGFIGIILRVVKNVIEAAVLIKEENDLTI